MKGILVTSLLALLIMPGLARAAYVFDGAGAISSGAEAELEKALRDFAKETNIVIDIETVSQAGGKSDAEIKKALEDLATREFKRYKLDSVGIPGLNFMIVYSKKERRAMVGFADTCFLTSSDKDSIVGILRTANVRSEFISGNLDSGFLNAIESILQLGLKEKVMSRKCIAPGETEVYFEVSDSVWKPRDRNGYGMGLDRDLNSYDDGIVTVYDPLVCYLAGAGVLKEVEFTITENNQVASGYPKKEPCQDGYCVHVTKPGSFKRGVELRCYVTINGRIIVAPEKLVAAKYIFVFYPVNQDNLGNAQEQFQYFMGLDKDLEGRTIQKPVSSSIKPIYLKNQIKWDYKNPADHFATSKYVEKTFYNADLNFDKFIAVYNDLTNFDNIGGSTRMGEFSIVISGNIEISTLAHELGHAFSCLCDEYKKDVWESCNRELLFKVKSALKGCPGKCLNEYPQCCEGQSTCKIGDMWCAGMPYSDKYTPAPEMGMNAPYYSIMGMDTNIANTKFIYPAGSQCPLRNC